MKNFERLGFALACYVGLGILLLLICGLLGIGALGVPLALALWFATVAGTLRWFLVIVPQQTTVVLVDRLKGTMRELSPGVAFKLPWEDAPMENFLELRTLNVSIDGEFIANDGPVVRLKGTLQIRINPERGLTVVGHTEEAFFEGIKQRCASFLSDFIAARAATEVRRTSQELEQQLLRHLRAASSSLESEFGAEATLVSVAGVTFDEKYQKIRTESAAATELTDIAHRLRMGTMTEADALEAAMVVSGDIKKRIFDVRGAGADALSARLLAIAQAMKP